MIGKLYLITNKINNKQYIGQTINSLNHRFNQHVAHAKLRVNTPICKAFNKYGKNNFSINLLEECSISALNEKEKHYIQKYNTYYKGYNATLGGAGGTFIKYDNDLLIKTYSETNGNVTACAKIAKLSKETTRLHLIRLGIHTTKNINKRKIIATELNIIFDCTIDCAKFLLLNNMTNASSIDAIASGIRKSLNSVNRRYLGILFRFI